MGSKAERKPTKSERGQDHLQAKITRIYETRGVNSQNFFFFFLEIFFFGFVPRRNVKSWSYHVYETRKKYGVEPLLLLIGN